MDDFRAAALAMTDLSDGSNPQWGYAGNLPDFGNTANGPMFYGWGVDPFNEDETQIQLDSDDARAAVQFWVDIIHVDKSAPTPAESTAFEQGAWIAGRVAMSNVASWSTPTIATFASFAWDVAPWPQGPVTRGTGSFGSGFGVTRDSQQVQEGWNYLREYLSKEGMETMWGSTGRGSPARKDAYDSWLNSDPAPENAEAFLEALDTYAKTDRPYQTLAGGEILDILNRQTTLLKNGEADPAPGSIRLRRRSASRRFPGAGSARDHHRQRSRPASRRDSHVDRFGDEPVRGRCAAHVSDRLSGSRVRPGFPGPGHDASQRTIRLRQCAFVAAACPR
jgi:multiple sugar transport system substrate-binding protein